MTRISPRAFSITVVLGIILTLGIGTGVLAAFGLQPQGSGDTTVSTASVLEARQAAVSAAQKTGFLSLAASDLSEGVGELEKGAGELSKGIDHAAGGGQELSGGMQQLQAGTAELGAGATQMADGMEAAAQGALALKVVRGQMLENLNSLDKSLAQSQDPNAQALREDLVGYKAQLQNVDVEKIQGELNTAEEKSRELANQLSTPGYAYYDGVVSAVQGASSLSSGLSQLQKETQSALGGIKDLSAGAHKVKTMAQDNQTAVNKTAQAFPATQMSEVTSGDNASSLSPIYAVLIAALVMVGSVASGVVWALRKSGLVAGAGIAAVVVAGSGLIFLLAEHLAPLAAVGVVVALALFAIFSAGVTAWWTGLITRGVISSAVGTGLLLLGTVLQLGVVAWAWSVESLAVVGRIIAGLFPLNYVTGVLVSAGNLGSSGYLWTSGAVLLLLSIFGALLLRIKKQ